MCPLFLVPTNLALNFIHDLQLTMCSLYKGSQVPYLLTSTDFYYYFNLFTVLHYFGICFVP